MSWPEIVARVDVRFPLPVEVTLQPTEGGYRLLVSLAVIGIHDGLPRKIYGAAYVGEHDEADAFRTIRELILQLLEHELDETFNVDGRQLYDPHSGPRESVDFRV